MQRYLISTVLLAFFLGVIPAVTFAANKLTLPKSGSPAWNFEVPEGWSAKYEDDSSIKAKNGNDSFAVTLGYADMQSAENVKTGIENYARQNKFTLKKQNRVENSGYPATVYTRQLRGDDGRLFDVELSFFVVDGRYVFNRIIFSPSGSAHRAERALLDKHATIVNKSGSASEPKVADDDRNRDPKEGEVTLTVTGVGKTFDEAQRQAFQDAIMQTYGVFVSSNTEVVREKLTSDTVNTITSGSIRKFDLLTRTELPDGGRAVTLRVTVSPQAVHDSIQSKADGASIAGNLIAFRFKQQILNEKNEVAAAQNIVSVLKQLLDESLDYRVDVSGDATQSGSDKISLPINITITFNRNVERFTSYLRDSLNGLAMTKGEIASYKNAHKTMYSLLMVPPASQASGKALRDDAAAKLRWAMERAESDVGACVYLRTKQAAQLLESLFFDYLPARDVKIFSSDKTLLYELGNPDFVKYYPLDSIPRKSQSLVKVVPVYLDVYNDGSSSMDSLRLVAGFVSNGTYVYGAGRGSRDKGRSGEPIRLRNGSNPIRKSDDIILFHEGKWSDYREYAYRFGSGPSTQMFAVLESFREGAVVFGFPCSVTDSISNIERLQGIQIQGKK